MVPPCSGIWYSIAAALVLLGFHPHRSSGSVINEATTYSLVELLVSDRAHEVAKGESQLAEQKPAVLANLLKRIESPVPKVRGKAASELGIIIGPWLRGREASERFLQFSSIVTLCKPVDRIPHSAESESIRNSLQRAASALLDDSKVQQEQSREAVVALDAICETLGEVADDQTIDWAIAKLPHIKAPRLGSPLVALVQSHLGIAVVSVGGGGYCGNSTPDEVAKLNQVRQRQFEEACKQLSAIWQKLRPMKAEDRIAFAIKSWRDHFVPIQRSSSGHYIHDGWLFLEMEPLVRLGTPAVNLLRAQQASETELEVKAVWEFVIATITGREDAALVRTLFEGSDAHRKLACEIVVGAKSKNWLRELEELQRRPGFDTGKASQAIAACHREAGIPALRRGLAWNPDNFHAQYGIQELEMRARQGSPKGMRRYRFW